MKLLSYIDFATELSDSFDVYADGKKQFYSPFERDESSHIKLKERTESTSKNKFISLMTDCFRNVVSQEIDFDICSSESNRIYVSNTDSGDYRIDAESGVISGIKKKETVTGESKRRFIRSSIFIMILSFLILGVLPLVFLKSVIVIGFEFSLFICACFFVLSLSRVIKAEEKTDDNNDENKPRNSIICSDNNEKFDIYIDGKKLLCREKTIFPPEFHLTVIQRKNDSEPLYEWMLKFPVKKKGYTPSFQPYYIRYESDIKGSICQMHLNYRLKNKFPSLDVRFDSENCTVINEQKRILISESAFNFFKKRLLFFSIGLIVPSLLVLILVSILSTVMIGIACFSACLILSLPIFLYYLKYYKTAERINNACRENGNSQ